MIVDTRGLSETAIGSFHGGSGTVYARMYSDGSNRILVARLPPGSSIGEHRHADNQETMHFLEGVGRIVCDGVEEIVEAGVTHLCQRGSTHSLENIGDTNLVVFCSVVNLGTE